MQLCIGKDWLVLVKYRLNLTNAEGNQRESGTRYPLKDFQNTSLFCFFLNLYTEFHFLSLFGENNFVPVSVNLD